MIVSTHYRLDPPVIASGRGGVQVTTELKFINFF